MAHEVVGDPAGGAAVAVAAAGWCPCSQGRSGANLQMTRQPPRVVRRWNVTEPSLRPATVRAVGSVAYHGRRGRRASLRVRRRRAIAGATALVLLSLLLVVLLGPGRSAPAGTQATGARPDRTPAAGTQTQSRVEATVLATGLPSPLSREAAYPVGRGDLLLVGGLTPADTSSSIVTVLDTATGTVSSVGSLAVPTHDAGGARNGRSALLFGGGQATSVATVEAFPLSRATIAPSAAGQTRARVVGALPGPRSDDVAVAMGGIDYVVGGYNGTVGTPGVLATTNGRTFRTVATLPVPVRYPAVAAFEGRVYVFGGEAVTGPQAGQPVPDVQVVDPARHSARVAGYLKHPLEGAAAAVLGGHIYLAGGNSGLAPGAAAATTTVTVSTVWRFDPQRATTTVVAQLPVPVSNAGLAVTGTTAWLVGGETNGTVRSDIQRLTLIHS